MNDRRFDLERDVPRRLVDQFEDIVLDQTGRGLKNDFPLPFMNDLSHELRTEENH